MWNFAKLDTTPLNSPLSLFSASCHPQTVKYHNENPLSCHPLPLKLLPTCENIGLQSHLGPRNSQAHSSAPHPHPQCAPATPPMRPGHNLPPHPQPHPQCAPATPTAEPPDAPLPPDPHSLPTPKSHVIPPGLYSPIARKPRNINDLISKPETPSGELRAKLLGSARVSPHRGHRAQAATHPDR